VKSRVRELNPDGAVIAVQWWEMQIGDSFFAPCVNIVRAREQLLIIARDNAMTLRSRVRVEHGMLGLRVWRIA
jgi:hypothetical protein